MNNENIDKNFEGKYRIIKKKLQELEGRYTRETILTFSLLCLFITSTVIIFILAVSNRALIRHNKELTKENIELSAELDIFFDTALHFADVSVKMDENNAELKGMLEQAEKDMEEYRNREELYDKYKFALVDPTGKKTDLTYAQIESLQEYCETKGYTNEMVDLVLAIAMKESTCHEKAMNPDSGASGYGQFLDSTAKFVYTKIQGHETYTHDDSLNGEKSLKMICDYMAYLYGYHDNSMEKAMISYRGCYDEPYMVKIDSYLAKNGLSLETIKIIK